MKELREPAKRWVLRDPASWKRAGHAGPSGNALHPGEPSRALAALASVSRLRPASPGSSLVRPDQPGLRSHGIHRLARRDAGEKGGPWPFPVSGRQPVSARADRKPWRPKGGQRMGRCQKGGPGGGGAPGGNLGLRGAAAGARHTRSAGASSGGRPGGSQGGRDEWPERHPAAGEEMTPLPNGVKPGLKHKPWACLRM